MLFKELLAFLLCHANKNSRFVDVDGQTIVLHHLQEAWNLIEGIKELLSRAKNAAPKEIVSEDLQVSNVDDLCKFGCDVASITSPNQG